MAMHLNIYPHFNKGMQTMKFVNNHPDEFDSEFWPYMLGFAQVVYSFIFEAMNIAILYSRSNIYLTIGSYVTVSIVVDLQAMYY